MVACLPAAVSSASASLCSPFVVVSAGSSAAQNIISITSPIASIAMPTLLCPASLVVVAGIEGVDVGTYMSAPAQWLVGQRPDDCLATRFCLPSGDAASYRRVHLWRRGDLVRHWRQMTWEQQTSGRQLRRAGRARLRVTQQGWRSGEDAARLVYVMDGASTESRDVQATLAVVVDDLVCGESEKKLGSERDLKPAWPELFGVSREGKTGNDNSSPAPRLGSSATKQ